MVGCRQRHRFTEEDYRGERFKSFHREIKGNNDILSLTQVCCAVA
jgi:5-methyltetrahydrofolate--homocysteine methyltransferase